MTTTWWCQNAWLPDGLATGVRVVSGDDGRIIEVSPNTEPSSADTQLNYLVLPGFANVHSHAFHRGLRGRTHSGGTFWTWRERMYALAERLTPDAYLDLATAVFAEMALAGVTTVGEFHYLHHGLGGARYADPNEMGLALREAARRAGVRLTLLDTCYLRGGIDVPLAGVQRRFDDGDAMGWAERVSAMQDDDSFLVGAAVHSVRAVPRDQLALIAEATRNDETGDRPLHVHVSEQPAENEACLSAYGLTPTELLAEAGVLGRSATAVHAVHLTDDDVRLLGETGTTIGACPTTELDLADGVGPVRRLLDAGTPIALGSDQHAQIDMLGEARCLEMAERARSGQRGRFTMDQLAQALTTNGHRALGWSDVGQIEVGSRCDLVGLRFNSLRTAGSMPEQMLLVASASDVDVVVRDGVTIVSDGRHLAMAAAGGVPMSLSRAIERAWCEE